MSGRPPVPILMYHSISDGPGPLCIPSALFRDQMAMLADAGRYAVTLSQYKEWREGGRNLNPGFVVLTFDDGYLDFAVEAAPVLAQRGWGATVFVPAGMMGKISDWERNDAAGKPLMDPAALRAVFAVGIEIGSHAITHRDLTALSFGDAVREISQSRAMLEETVGAPVRCFAPPYGGSRPKLRDEIARHYDCSAGTRLGLADGTWELMDLPRIEMWYFRDPRRYRALLENGDKWYLMIRRALRALRRQHR